MKELFVEGDTVLTRRWTWRQANHTLTVSASRAIVFNVDGLPPVSAAQVEAACADFVELASRLCGGRMRTELLVAGNPRISLAA